MHGINSKKIHNSTSYEPPRPMTTDDIFQVNFLNNKSSDLVHEK